MKDPFITNAEIAIIEKLYSMWEKFEISEDKIETSKAASLSCTICAAVPKLISEIKRLKEVTHEK